MTSPWRIQLLGGLCAEQSPRVITRFRTRKTGVLLAYLAYYSRQPHPREVLIDLLWPESGLESGRHNLSLALSSLRQVLEGPGTSTGSVILADRAMVRLNPDAVVTDVAEFEAALQAAAQAEGAERARRLIGAVEIYRGTLLPGFCEDWLLAEQQRLADLLFRALRELLALLEGRGELLRALEYARRAVRLDPLREEAHRELMRLLALTGNPSAALLQYAHLARVLETELGAKPSAASRALIEQIRNGSVSRGAGPTRSASAPSNPTGTVTFMISAIDGTEAPRLRPGPAFRTALERHDALLREEIRRHGGCEVERAEASFTAAFTSAGEALACALAAHRALAASAGPKETGTPQVRMALHSGDVRIVDGAYHGPTLQVTEGLLLAARAGQVLCCEATSVLLQRHLEAGVRLLDLGVYRLRNIARPERVFQVEYPEMPRRRFPPPDAEPLHP